MAVNHASDFRPQARSEIAMRNETVLLYQRECFAHFFKDIYWSTSAFINLIGYMRHLSLRTES